MVKKVYTPDQIICKCFNCKTHKINHPEIESKNDCTYNIVYTDENNECIVYKINEGFAK